VLDGDGLADGAKDFVEVALLAPLDLLDHDKLLVPVLLDGEGRAGIRTESLVGALDRLFDVLGIDVHAVEDNEILDASRDEQLAAVKESEIAGPKKRPVARVLQPSLKNVFAQFGFLPIA